MKKKRYSEELIVRILKEAEAGVKVDELIRKYGIARNTLHRWRSGYSDIEVSDVRRLKELEDENRRLKKLVAEQALEIDAAKAILNKSGEGRRTEEGCG